MTDNELMKACNALEFIEEVYGDLCKHDDLGPDCHGEAFRDLLLAKLDLAIGELEQLKNYHFLERCKKSVDLSKSIKDAERKAIATEREEQQMTHDEYSTACKVLATISEIKSDLMARIDLDAYEEAHRDLTVAKLDSAIGQIKNLQALHFINKQKELPNNYNGKPCDNSHFDEKAKELLTNLGIEE